LRPVLSSAKALLSLIHDLLDLAQLKAGKFKLMHFDFNLIELFEELKRFLETNVQQKGTHIEIDVAPDLNADIISDGNRIR
jgi:protein-histidine pros-kinase